MVRTFCILLLKWKLIIPEYLMGYVKYNQVN
jgi:hypothetical protein